eukprot:CAMPEP_0201915966 /NCGR_PEP_ID=MMETSP0903-20130614/5731_1 /ASSEMBLY_ACC=CAM_ASM_000552 /TAXON_ID=420261 /ORGANISM="Thalassiosira antarctica, Strain CCMP982" /LENGTH=89 /DNA_ID=CAMNT_0048451691 /DNA_START=217 /DNA_END=482 /DNA_ORIENTATION=+
MAVPLLWYTNCGDVWTGSELASKEVLEGVESPNPNEQSDNRWSIEVAVIEDGAGTDFLGVGDGVRAGTIQHNRLAAGAGLADCMLFVIL